MFRLRDAGGLKKIIVERVCLNKYILKRLMIYFENAIKRNFLTDSLWRKEENGIMKKNLQFSVTKLVIFEKKLRLENKSVGAEYNYFF